MTIVRKAGGRIRGLSSDTKPTAASERVNTVFEETDTGDEFRNNGTTWVRYLIPSNTITGGGGGGGAGQPTQTWSVYYSSGTTIEALNNKTGSVVYTNTSGNIDPVLTSIIDAISPAGTPTVIEIGEGDFKQVAPFTAIDSDRVGNIRIKGQGPGLTNIILEAGCIKGWQIEGATSTGKALTATASEATYTVTVSTANAATFAVGDYVMLRSDYFWLTTSTTTPLKTSSAARQGEIHRIKAINTGTGVITFHETLADTYVTAGNSVIEKLSMLKNITLEDLTIRPIATGYTGQTGALLWCKWIDNLQLKNVEVSDNTIQSANNAAVYNVINSKIDLIATQTGAYPFVDLPSTGQYGLYVGLACQHLTIHITARGIWRHAITGGGTNTTITNAGVSRDITVSGTAEAGMSYAFDWHADADGLVFQNCNVMAIGALPDNATHNTGGVNSRARNTQIIGCSIRLATGVAINLSENANRTLISGNTVASPRAFSNATNGMIITLNTGTVGCVITGNMFYDSNNVNFGVYLEGANNDTVITGNVFSNSAPIRGVDSVDVVVSGNRMNNGTNKAINMSGTCDRWVIIGNNAQGSATSTFVGAGNMKLAGTNVNL
jgi:hypothetical protein